MANKKNMKSLIKEAAAEMARVLCMISEDYLGDSYLINYEQAKEDLKYNPVEAIECFTEFIKDFDTTATGICGSMATIRAIGTILRDNAVTVAA